MNCNVHPCIRTVAAMLEHLAREAALERAGWPGGGPAAEVGSDVVGGAAGVLAGVGADADCPEVPVQQVGPVGRTRLPHHHDRSGGDIADGQVLADPTAPVAPVADPGGPARAV